MTKETKLRAKMDRQIAKGSPKAHVTLAKLLRMKGSASEMDTFWANTEILFPSSAEDENWVTGYTREGIPSFADYLELLNQAAMVRDEDDETEALVRQTVSDSQNTVADDTAPQPLWDEDRNTSFEKGLTDMARRDQCGRV